MSKSHRSRVQDTWATWTSTEKIKVYFIPTQNTTKYSYVFSNPKE
jgi:hypothetical protein